MSLGTTAREPLLPATDPPKPTDGAPKDAAVGVGSLPITGFVAGVLSGVTKLVIGHPFDTLKVRMQVDSARFNNSVVTCLRRTVAQEGLRGLYKGGTPPLFGWAVMDSVMLGSLSNYRRLLAGESGQLTLPQHALAGLGAGLTVSLVATPIEHVKARLQIQYDASSKVYSGPIDCIMRLVRQRKLYKGLVATMAQRSWFSAYWATYAVCQSALTDSKLSPGAKSFWAGGLAASLYWFFAFPADVVKQRIMTDSLTNPRYKSWADCVKQIWTREGLRGLYRGFTPCFLRSFPTNASAVFVFDTTMRYMTQFGF
ncbi:hypothetical protein PYCC9005_000445 [Savitreella phatthalungensis]